MVEEFGVVCGVALCAWDGGAEGEAVVVVGGVDAGLSVEGVDFESGVVGEAVEVGGACVVGGLESGVGFEGVAVFGWFGDGGCVGEVGEGEELCGREDVAEFFEFVWVGGGEEDGGHGGRVWGREG